MNHLHLENIVPQVMLAGSATFLVALLVFIRNHLMTNILTVLLLAASALAAIFFPPEYQGRDGLFTVDGFGQYVVFLIISSAVIVTVLSYAYLEKYDINREEFYVLIILGTLGACSLAVSNHFIIFLLGLELLSLSIFIMTGYLKIWGDVIEAAVKYLILASVSSAFLLMGMALVYTVSGSMNFSGIGSAIMADTQHMSPYMLAGTGLIIIGVGFKLAVVPFHMWVADVYQGAPAHSAGFIASISKGAIVAVFLGFYTRTNIYHSIPIQLVIAILSILSMLTGNILALMQNNVKRILGYSSIAHFGYILIPFVSGGALGTESVAFYLLVYLVSILGAFGIIILVSGEKQDAQNLSDFRGMFWRKPWHALIFTIMLLSLAGIPVTAGFIGKFYILSAGIAKGYWYLALVLIISSVIGLFYYLRIVAEMFRDPGSTYPDQGRARTIPGGNVVLAILMFLVLWIGLNPGMVSRLIHCLVGNASA